MKVINGDFSKSKPAKMNLHSKISKAVDKIQEETGNNAQGTFILLTETEGAITMSSDLNAEDFNYLLDTVKLNLLLTSTLPE